MTVSFVVGCRPIGVNAAYRRRRGPGRGLMLTDEAKAYKSLIAGGARVAMRGAPPLLGGCGVRLAFYWPDRRHDLDAALKLTLDALQGAAYANDSQVERLHVEKLLDRERPRVEVEVEPLAGAEVVAIRPAKQRASRAIQRDLLQLLPPKKRGALLERRLVPSVRRP